MLSFTRRSQKFPELSYANRHQPRLKRWFIRSVEGLSGRERYAGLYGVWKDQIVPTRERVFGRMLDLIGVSLRHAEAWPPADLPDGPLLIVANHPFGIGDGVAALALAESLGRPFRVMISADLLKIPEMEAYSLPVDFSETKEALRNNIAIRHEALRLLKEGVTIVVFPAGGVATATTAFGPAEDLRWKMFPAKLVQEAKASVIPMYFSGQNGRLFHIVSQPMLKAENGEKVSKLLSSVSLTLRTSLLIREFARLAGHTIDVRIGRVHRWSELSGISDRKALLARLHSEVFSLALPETRKRGTRMRLPRLTKRAA